jgi:crotonobetaine/carnitine-CoA ligase
MQEKIAHKTASQWSVCTARTVTEFVHKHCTRLPDQAVLIYEDGVAVKRRELLDQSERFAAYLSDRVKAGDHVAIMIGNRTEYFIALYATIANRAVLVSLNPDAKEHDAGYVLRDSGSVLVICGAEQRPLIERLRAECPGVREIVTIDGPEPAGLAHCRGSRKRFSFANAKCERDDITVIYYTSGTTGAPKGCMLHHGWWLRIIDVDLRLNPDGRERGFCSVPFYYSDPALYLMYAMQVGGSLVPMRKFSVSRYWDVIRANNVTKVHAIASIPVLLLKAQPSARERDHHIHHATCVAIPANMHKQLHDRFGFPWLDNYGATEVGQICRMPLSHIYEMTGKGSMGVPDPEVELRICDEQDRDVPVGQPGQILIRAPDMFKGYLNNPEVTAEALKNGWYHSGDLGCLDERGFVYFLGRQKDIIRRSGENLAASEVEAVLRSHPKILDVAVIPVPDEIRGEEVKAYVQLVEGATPDAVPPEELAALCAGKLAAFKVPRYIEYRRTDFPRTPSMRIQKEMLKKEKANLTEGAWDREASRPHRR